MSPGWVVLVLAVVVYCVVCLSYAAWLMIDCRRIEQHRGRYRHQLAEIRQLPEVEPDRELRA